jgi:hypothetical protein
MSGTALGRFLEVYTGCCICVLIRALYTQEAALPLLAWCHLSSASSSSLAVAELVHEGLLLCFSSLQALALHCAAVQFCHLLFYESLQSQLLPRSVLCCSVHLLVTDHTVQEGVSSVYDCAAENTKRDQLCDTTKGLTRDSGIRT